MTAAITAEERALIDAALAAGKVERVDPGASALWNYQWCPRHKKLRHVDHIAGIKRPPGYYLQQAQAGRRPKPKRAGREAFLAKVRELHEAGVPRSQIAERLGRPYNAICRAYDELGLKATGARPENAQQIARKQRVARLRELLSDGVKRSSQELRGILGVTETVYWDDVAALRASLPPDDPLSMPQQQRAAIRREAVRAAMRAPTPINVPALAAEHGVRPGTIYADIHAIRRKK